MKREKTGFTHESQAAGSIEWYTPPSMFEGLMTRFDMDVCAPEGGLPWIPADKFLSKKDNGLTTPWTGFVWCNPPYGKETPIWLEKCQAHGNGIALVFARTDCRWFHDYVADAEAILLLRGRVKFVDGRGASGNSGAGNGSMLVAYGAKARRVIKNARLNGVLVRSENSLNKETK